jgi:O-antigen biosynthesis protein
MKVLALAGDISSQIADIRLITPLRAWAQAFSGQLTQRSFHDCSRADLRAADVLVVQRACTPRVHHLQRAMRLAGGAVVYEIDDLLTDIAPHISNQAGVLSRLEFLQWCLAESDLVTVTTPRLAAELALPVERFDCVPNYAHPVMVGEEPIRHHGPGLVTLLFASSDHLATDFVYEPLRRLQSMHPGAFEVVVVGPPGAAFEAAGIRIRRYPLLPRNDFVTLARSLNQPLAVIPLEDSRFAACKSAIKWFDYSLAGIPVLCSNVSPYREVMGESCATALVHNNEGSWQTALWKAITDASCRQRIADTAQQHVEANHRLDGTVLAWNRALNRAVQQRAQATLPDPGWFWRGQEWWAAACDLALIDARRWNRARLQKRKNQAQ